MCAIVGGFVPKATVARGVAALAHRGPDARGAVAVGGVSLGHARLAIIDIDRRSDQPFCHGATTVSFNGEIWNFKALRAELAADGVAFRTRGDTEVLAALLDREGAAALPRLQGMFAVAWARDDAPGALWLARDRFGETPLHVAKQRPFLFASELKGLLAMGADRRSFDDLPPGCHAEVKEGAWTVERWYDAPAAPCAPTTSAEAAARLRGHVEAGAVERTISDAPVSVLLSGGIDSAATALFAARARPGIVAYTAVFDPKSRDLRCAREVAERVGVTLVEVPVPAPTADDVRRVVAAIEMDFKAQVEIAWPCLKLAEAIAGDGCKVTFSGEGSDELWASYGFAYHGLQTQDWHLYRKRLFVAQARKNFLRCNKVFMARGVECRLPFLNTGLVEFAFSLPRSVVQAGHARPKAVLQDAMVGLLPESVLRRPKLAFQDGLGIKGSFAAVAADPRRFYGAEFRRLYA